MTSRTRLFALVLLLPAVLFGADKAAVKGPIVPATPTPLPQAASRIHVADVLNTPSHAPDQMDFGSVWNGESAKRTLSLTTIASGYVTVEIPRGPFRVAEYRELGGSTGGQTVVQFGMKSVKARTTYADGQSGPFQWSLAPNTAIEVDIVFQPHFDLFTMAAGPKSATMKVTGPGPHGAWAFNVPLRGMFDGMRTSPLLILPEKDILSVADPFETVQKFVVRLVGTGEDVSGRIVWPSASPGLKVKPYGNVSLDASETKEFTVPVEGTGGHTDKTPLDGAVAFEFVRRGQSAPQQTVAVPFRVSFVPGYFGRDLGPAKCNGVQLTLARVTIYANGNAHFSVTLGPQAYESHFEVFFPQAGRTLFHTIAPADLRQQIRVRAEENGPGGLATVNQSFTINFDGRINPGPGSSLDRYLALMHSTATLRCW